MGQEPLHSWCCIWTYCQLGNYPADAFCLVARGGDDRLQAYHKYNVFTRLAQLYMYIVEMASSWLQKLNIDMWSFLCGTYSM